jgi:hypothetical protein
MYTIVPPFQPVLVLSTQEVKVNEISLLPEHHAMETFSGCGEKSPSILYPYTR